MERLAGPFHLDSHNKCLGDETFPTMNRTSQRDSWLNPSVGCRFSGYHRHGCSAVEIRLRKLVQRVWAVCCTTGVSRYFGTTTCRRRYLMSLFHQGEPAEQERPACPHFPIEFLLSTFSRECTLCTSSRGDRKASRLAAANLAKSWIHGGPDSEVLA